MPERFDTVEAMRRRPGMFIGDVDDGSGLVHLVWEVLANAIDEHLDGACHDIAITLHDDGGVTVEDDGRGIPPSIVETIFTRHHGRPTFEGHERHVHVGLHGVGVVCVSALSSRTEVETVREGRRYVQTFAAGVATCPLQDKGPTVRRGTRVSFVPDTSIFTHTELDATAIRARLDTVAALCPGLAIRFTDERRTVYASPRGIRDMLARAYARRGTLPEVALHAKGERDKVSVEVAFQWANHATSKGVRSFVNLHETHEGGTHVTGLHRAVNELVRALPPAQRFARARALRARLVGIISVFHHDPTFDSPTKSRLKSPEVRPLVEEVVRACLRDFAATRPLEAERLIGG